MGARMQRSGYSITRIFLPPLLAQSIVQNYNMQFYAINEYEETELASSGK